MPKARQNFVIGNQFTPVISFEEDVLVPNTSIPPNSTLNRTWIDVRFNQFGTGTLPPEFLNKTGPVIWGLCLIDDSTGSPGVHAEDDSVDWLWREMVAWGPSVATVPDLSSTPQWMRASQSATGLRDGHGQRTRGSSNTFFHFCINLPTVFGNAPDGVLFEVFVHSLWTTR